MYKKILVAIDGSEHSDLAIDAALAIAEKCGSASVTGCHVYAANMHRTRFVEMEPGLPGKYQKAERLQQLRDTHDEIIGGGMKIISDAYLAPLSRKAEKVGIRCRLETPEGRNYVEILKLIADGGFDLVVLGACGFGKADEANIGSVAERILLLARPPDLLLVRKPFQSASQTFVVGVDGSDNSYAAVDRAAGLASIFGARLQAFSVYDPFFHLGVFGKITEALPDKERARFNFSAQEKLHDEIIDKGLEKLYREGLDRGLLLAKEADVHAEGSVLTGKPYVKLLAASQDAGLVLMGRWGSHREEGSPIGSNSLGVARLSGTNVLIAAPREHLKVPMPAGSRKRGLTWTSEALAIVDRIPDFARPMAMGAIENRARKAGRKEVNADTVREVAALFGMGQKAGGAPSSAEGPEAELVVFRKVKALAPDFHKNILKSRIGGTLVEEGERILVYEVEETAPKGKVKVTERTRLVFK